MGFDVASFQELKRLAQSRADVTYLSFCDPPIYGFDPPAQALPAVWNLFDLGGQI